MNTIPDASFLLIIELEIKGIDSTVPVTSIYQILKNNFY